MTEASELASSIAGRDAMYTLGKCVFYLTTIMNIANYFFCSPQPAYQLVWLVDLGREWRHYVVQGQNYNQRSHQRGQSWVYGKGKIRVWKAQRLGAGHWFGWASYFTFGDSIKWFQRKKQRIIKNMLISIEPWLILHTYSTSFCSNSRSGSCFPIL